MNWSEEQERHEEKEIMMGGAGLYCLGGACRGTPGMVAIVSAKEDFLPQYHLSGEQVGPQKLRSKGIQHHSSLKKNYLLNTY